jgi:16S rRNA (cytosine967-C5)-methyltransferase
MKLHRNLVEAVLISLKMIFEEDRFADKVIEKALKSNLRWGARDRAFIAENVYEIVRWWRLLLYLMKVENLVNPSQYGEGLEFYWRLFGTWQLSQGEELPAWDEFRNLSTETILKRLEEARKTRKIIESLPDWLDEMGEKELGEKWDSEVKALNFQAPVILRTNRLKITRNELQKSLAENEVHTKVLQTQFFQKQDVQNGIESGGNIETINTDNLDLNEKFYHTGLKDALVLERRTNIFSSTQFKSGFFEIQDAASQLVAPFLDIHEGMRVIDACAGAGGKTLHLASLMNNKGRIIALDTEEWKLEELKKRAKRNGASNIETRLIDSTKIIKRLYDSADRLLLDVPCSGLGVLRRNPDAKWKLQPDFIERIKQTQVEILNSYSKMLKVGGKMVYATCSILPSESEMQVQKFIESQGGKFELLGEQRISPAKTGFDGFYMACLLRK